MRSEILITFCSVWMAVVGLEFPPFIRKCSLSDPNLRHCIIDNANFAIPKLFKGGLKSNWPLLSPLLVSELELPGPGFILTLRDVRLEGLENFKMTDINFSLERKRQNISFATPLYLVTADYTIQEEGLFTRSTLGGGKMRLTLEQTTLNYSWNLEQIEKEGEVHLKYDSGRLALKTERVLYKFNDFYVPNAINLGSFLGKHKEIVDYMIRTAVEQIVFDYIRSIMDNIIETIPLKDIFDP
ncbi:hypothetical protein Trydic_g9011 [Trypoxylus dichotomus]